MKIDGVNVAGGHGRKIEAFARGVGAGEIESHVIAHHESDDRQCNVVVGADADADHDVGDGSRI